MTLRILTALPILSAASVFAATSFEAESPIYINNVSTSVIPADLDGDGDLDLVVSGSGAATVVENAGGSFASTIVISAVSSVAYPADIDGDTDLDIVVFDRRSASITWSENIGSGNFGSPVAITNFFEPRVMFPPADIDGDGDIDIFFQTSNRSTVYYLLNSGTGGTFGSTTAVNLPSGNLVSPVAIDIDGDGRPELISSDNRGTNAASDDAIISYAFAGTGPITIAGPTTLAEGHRFVGVGLIDGDSDLDLVVRDYALGRIEWLTNDGSGVYTTGGDIGESGFPSTATVADGDIFISADFEPVVYYSGTGGSFAAAVTIETPDSSFNHLAAGDFDGDGRADLITTESTGSRLHLQESAGSFASPVVVSAAIGDIQAVVIDAASGGNVPDIFFATEAGKIFRTAKAEGGFSGLVQVSEGHGEVTQIYLADIDGVNGPDLVSIATNDNRVRWCPRNVDGSFAPPITVDSSGSFPNAAAFGDFDGDTDLDIAVSYGGDDACGWHSLDAGGSTFTFNPLPGVVSSARGIAVGDLDSDEDTDIYCGSFSTGNIFRYINNAGTFASAANIGTADTSLNTLDLADADADGDLDLFSSESSGVSSTVSLLVNDGAGNFAAANSFATERAGLRNIAFGDFDDDGDTDFASANSNDDITSWRENDGIGVFTKQNLTPDALSQPYNVAVGDLDADGDLDILVSSRFISRLGWHENTLVTAPPSDLVTTWALGLGVPEDEAIDLSSDGDFDGNTLVQEFAFGLDPLASDQPISATDTAFAYDRRKDATAIGLTYTPETSVDLSAWDPATLAVSGSVDDDYETVALPISSFVPRQFFRVGISYTPAQ